MYNITLVCLANSRKPPSGRCIAGKQLISGVTGDWVRPVSDRDKHEVSEEERRYENGQKAQLLDIVTVPMIQANPQAHQSENHTLDKSYYWTKEGVATWDQVLAAVDADDPLFWSHSQSTFHGTGDKVAAADLMTIGTSLRLAHVHDLRVHVRVEDGYQGANDRRRVRASFTVLGSHYLLSVTDPEFEERYLAGANGSYVIGEAVLCVSLVEEWNGYAFRVIASVIRPF
jgi:hypothetical protein